LFRCFSLCSCNTEVTELSTTQACLFSIARLTTCSPAACICSPTTGVSCHRKADALLHHQEATHVRCGDCGVWVPDAVGLHRHENSAHNHICPIAGCCLRFSSRQDLEDHLEGGHAYCSACNTWHLNIEALGLHQDLSHPSCSYCNRQFHSQKALNRHRYSRINGICAKATPGFTGTSFQILKKQGGLLSFVPSIT
jgi:hypothetical protein